MKGDLLMLSKKDSLKYASIMKLGHKTSLWKHSNSRKGSSEPIYKIITRIRLLKRYANFLIGLLANSWRFKSFTRLLNLSFWKESLGHRLHSTRVNSLSRLYRFIKSLVFQYLMWKEMVIFVNLIYLLWSREWMTKCL